MKRMTRSDSLCELCVCVFICELAIQNLWNGPPGALPQSVKVTHRCTKKSPTLPTKRLANEKSLLHTNTHSQTVLMVLGVEAEQKSLWCHIKYAEVWSCTPKIQTNKRNVVLSNYMLLQSDGDQYPLRAGKWGSVGQWLLWIIDPSVGKTGRLITVTGGWWFGKMQRVTGGTMGGGRS